MAGWLIALVLGVGCVPKPTETESPQSSPRAPTAPAPSLPPTTRPTSTQSTPQEPEITPSPTCMETVGQLEESSYRGVAVPEEIPFKVYLPPCYDVSGERFPALYLLHGYPFDESQWIDLGAIEIVEGLIRESERSAIVVVMPRQPEPLFRSSDGGPGSYEQEFLEGLLPAIEREYRVLPERSGRVVAGLSRGGVWALEIGLRNPDRFAAIGALSPALAVNYAREVYDPYYLAQEQEQIPDHIVLLAGEEDWALPGTQRLGGILTQRGIEYAWIEVPGGHEDSTWKAGLDAFLWHLTADWSDAP